MTISDIIKSTQDYGENLNAKVNSSFNELIHYTNTITNTIENESELPRKNHSVKHAALGFFALGVIGLISTDSMWPKVSIGTGAILSAYDILKGRQKREGIRTHTESIVPSNAQLSKQETQQKIKDIVRDIKQKWDKFTNINKNSLLSIIDESAASSNVKFEANNTAALSRKIQFSILPFVAKILGSGSSDELGNVLTDIRNNFITDISNTVANQISDYQSIAQKINQY